MISLDGSRVEEISVAEASGTGDHLKLKVPASLPAADYRIRVITANGAPAQVPGGADFLTIAVTT